MNEPKHPIALFRAASCIAVFLLTGAAHAVEGMFTPQQLPAMADELEQAGLELEATSLARLTAFPMGAVISLGGCTASFVSPKGLVVTNHHCARGSVQYNSSPEHNYLEDGFLAATQGDELRAAPGTRVYVTLEVQDVTNRITGDLDSSLSPRERFDLIEQRQKALISECEADPGHRCQVPAFFGGLEYRLIKRLEIRDVRIAYSPAESIGGYGGDVDNWQWPRHTGDFAFYRAYVSPEGLPADYSRDNRPFEPRHFLKVSRSGLEAGDFVMALGYPGSTARYARHASVEHTFDWRYPQSVKVFTDQISVIEAAAPEGSDARIRYASRLAGLNNSMKNLRGQIEGAKKNMLVARRAGRDARLDHWIEASASRAPLSEAITGLDELAKETAAEQKRSYWFVRALRAQLLGVAQRLYRLAQERRKPDSEREPGYQERDMNFFRERLNRIDRRYHADVDKAEWAYFLSAYLAQPEELRVAALDSAMGLERTLDEDALSSLLGNYYEGTQLDQLEVRLSLMDASIETLESSQDPFMRLAVSLYPTLIEREEAAKERAGRNSLLRPRYMQAIIAWQESLGHAAYPDANSTLRVTFGRVMGGSPEDGLLYEPFTRLEGILKKHTGEHPFDAPSAQLDRIRAGYYGGYALESLGSVPVNFLSDLDSTGGNSGSPTLNARGELAGLLFDGTIESVNSDWDFDPSITRTIHVDSRYMLWVMELVDGANALVEEMTLVP